MTKLILLFRFIKLYLFGGLFSCGWKVVLQNNVVIRKARYISIGSFVNLDSNVILQGIDESDNPHIGNPKFDFSELKLVIKDRVGISPNTVILANKKIVIDEGVMIGPGCTIVDFNHDFADINIPIHQQPLTNIQPIYIKKGAWIGANCTICPGVTIGQNTVIGANSVVLSDIPDFSVAAGTPAVVKKQWNSKSKTWKKVTR